MIKRLRASVRAWIRRHHATRHTTTFRRSQTNLDTLMGVRKRDDASPPRTRIRTATFRRSPGRKVEFPGEPPSEWRRRMFEDYLD